MPKKTADQTFVREINLSSVLRLIHTKAPISRAQIAVITGLNKSTVSSLVEELIERRLVHETGSNSTGTGRPATLLDINPQAGCIIGVDIEVNSVSVAVTDFLGNIFWRRNTEIDSSLGQEKITEQTLSIVKEAVAMISEKNLRCLGMGISIPGTVDIDQGILIFAPNLQWRNVPLRRIYSERTGLKVFIENDANAAAIAERLFGMARTSSDFIFVFAGAGIGGGLFLNGNLYRGKNGYAGEIGHFPIMAEPLQNPCHCGNLGCWETYANQDSIIKRAQSHIEAKRSSFLPKLMMEQNAPLSISIIKQAADMGDEGAIQSFAESGRAMGQGLAGLINIFNPEKIILGGPLSAAGQYLLRSIKDSVLHHSMSEIGQQADVALSSFGADASLIGAIAIVLDDALSNPSHVERR